jgi:glycogen debranching enzyme
MAGPDPRNPLDLDPTATLPREAPPELAPNAVAVLDGGSFCLSGPTGDVTPDRLEGVFHHDTRTISALQLTVDGVRPHLLSAVQEHVGEAGFYLQHGHGGRLPAAAMSVQRRRFMWGGMHEDVAISSHLAVPVDTTVELRIDADFADLFEVKAEVPHTTGTVSIERTAGGCTRRYRHEGFAAEVTIRFSEPAAWDGDVATFAVHLPTMGSWSLCVDVTWPGAHAGTRPIDERHAARTEPRRELERWRAAFPTMAIGSDDASHTLQRSVTDLAALRVEVRGDGEPAHVPAAGLPWFMTLFGRDSLLTSLQTIHLQPSMARDALHALAALQGTREDDFLDEEPGKILHELRAGELTVLGRSPHRPSYGSVDATPLWLVVLGEYWQVTQDHDTVRTLWPNVERALAWIRAPIGRSPDAPFLTYRTRSPLGLENQGWKDSGDAIRFRDGAVAHAPIAVCEVQGYAADALRKTAELARDVMDDAATAEGLEADASRLVDAIEEAFWMPERGTYALALDADGRQVNAIASNAGHLLWSRVARPDRAASVAEVLLSAPSWSGFGVRTMAASERGYHPTAYHRGTVWPHDNSLIALGLARAGVQEGCARIAEGMFAAARTCGYRLPEAFAGYARRETEDPVRYASASDPQAWASGTPLLLLRAILGLEFDRGTPTIAPAVPPSLGRIRIDGIRAGGRRWVVDAEGEEGTVAEV